MTVRRKTSKNTGRETQLKVLVSSTEKTWAEELARDAGLSVADLLRGFVKDAHVEKLRKEHNMSAEPVKLSDQDEWLHALIAKGGPVGEAVSIENIDHDARVQFGDEVMFTLGASLTKLREAGYIRKTGPNARDYEVVKKLPRSR